MIKGYKRELRVSHFASENLLLQNFNKIDDGSIAKRNICWVWPLPRITVTTRNMTCLV